MIGQARGRLPRLNLTLRMSPPEAAGQEFEAFADPHPRVIQVSLSAPGGWPLFRLWSDGVIEWAVFSGVSACEVGTDGHPWSVIPEEPVPLPRGIRVIEIFADRDSGPLQIVRVLSDGTVQRNLETGWIWCGWQDVPEP